MQTSLVSQLTLSPTQHLSQSNPRQFPGCEIFFTEGSVDMLSLPPEGSLLLKRISPGAQTLAWPSPSICFKDPVQGLTHNSHRKYGLNE